MPVADGSFSELLDESLFAPKSLEGAGLQELNTAWKLTEEIDYRVQVMPSKTGFRLINTAGSHVKGREPLGVLEAVHAALVRVFPTVITDKARRVWKLG